MGNKDGIAKNLEVVTDGIKSFGAEWGKIDGEVSGAWDERDIKEYLHKVSAPPPEFFEHCKRLLGYILFPVTFPLLFAWFTGKNIVREVRK